MLETRLVIGLSLFFLAWYGLGSWLNLRYKSRILRSLVDALGDLAREARYTSLGSSGFILEARSVKGYPRLGIAVFMGKRELPLLWLIDYVRGRRDRFELVAELPSSCSECLCFNLNSYWGRFFYRKARVELVDSMCTCTSGAKLWGQVLGVIYTIHARPVNGRCHLEIMGDPHGASRVVEMVLQEPPRA